MHVPTVSEDAVSLRVVAAVSPSLGRESGIRRGGSHITRSAAVTPSSPPRTHTLHLPLVLLTAPTSCTEFTEFDGKAVPHMETGVEMDGGRLVVHVKCEEGYLLVPKNATTLLCNETTGEWIFPQCLGT